jgi:hypothetical protein
MSPHIMKRLVDVVVAAALTAAVVFVIMFANGLLVARGSTWNGVNVWYSFMSRPDILGTIALTAVVSMAYVFWQQTRRPGGR